MVQGRQLTTEDHPADPPADCGQPGLEPPAAVRGSVRRMGLAQRQRPAQGHGHPHSAGEARCARSDHVACAAARAIEPHGRPASTPADLGLDTGNGNAARCGTADAARGQHGCRSKSPVCRRPGRVSLPGLPRHGRRESPVHGHGPDRPAACLPAVRLGGLEVSGARPVHRLGSANSGRAICTC